MTEVFNIRRKVFVEEMRMDEKNELDQKDQEAIHVIVFETPINLKDRKNEMNHAVATGRIIFDGERCTISHVAVLKDYRKQQYGDFTVKMLLNKAFTSGVPEVELDTTEQTEGFFKRIGFKTENTWMDLNGIKWKHMKVNTNQITRPCQNIRYQ